MSRGYTLIELMVSVSLIALGGVTLMSSFKTYQVASTHALQVEGLARVLDAEMERMRACEDRRCLRALTTNTATTANLSDAADSWVRASVRRTVRPDVDGTVRVSVEATLPGRFAPQRIESLMRVSP